MIHFHFFASSCSDTGTICLTVNIATGEIYPQTFLSMYSFDSYLTDLSVKSYINASLDSSNSRQHLSPRWTQNITVAVKYSKILRSTVELSTTTGASVLIKWISCAYGGRTVFWREGRFEHTHTQIYYLSNCYAWSRVKGGTIINTHTSITQQHKCVFLVIRPNGLQTVAWN